MNIKNQKKHYFNNTIDFLVANLIIVVVLTSIDSVLEILFPSGNALYIMAIPKPYTPFIEGIMAGVLIGMYILLKKKVNIIAMVLGMWLYPVVKYSLSQPVFGLESCLVYLSDLSMFSGVVCIFICITTSYNRVTVDSSN